MADTASVSSGPGPDDEDEEPEEVFGDSIDEDSQRVQIASSRSRGASTSGDIVMLLTQLVLSFRALQKSRYNYVPWAAPLLCTLASTAYVDRKNALLALHTGPVGLAVRASMSSGQSHLPSSPGGGSGQHNVRIHDNVVMLMANKSGNFCIISNVVSLSSKGQNHLLLGTDSRIVNLHTAQGGTRTQSLPLQRGGWLDGWLNMQT